MKLGDVLDLHTFRPCDVHQLVRNYIDECVPGHRCQGLVANLVTLRGGASR